MSKQTIVLSQEPFTKVYNQDTLVAITFMVDGVERKASQFCKVDPCWEQGNTLTLDFYKEISKKDGKEYMKFKEPSVLEELKERVKKLEDSVFGNAVVTEPKLPLKTEPPQLPEGW